jgi:hypothetical protein
MIAKKYAIFQVKANPFKKYRMRGQDEIFFVTQFYFFADYLVCPIHKICDRCLSPSLNTKVAFFT